MSQRGIHLDLVDAVDLLGALEFVAEWLTTDRDQLEASLHRFASDHYRLDDLHEDLLRLVYVVGQARGVALDRMRLTR